MYSILLNLRINLGNRDRRFDLRIKRCLGSETNLLVMKFLESKHCIVPGTSSFIFEARLLAMFFSQRVEESCLCYLY